MKFKLMLGFLAVLFMSCFHFSTIESLIRDQREADKVYFQQKVILSPNQQEAYLIDEGSLQLYSINLATGQREQCFALESCPQNLVFSADAKFLYVTYEDLKAITPIAPESGLILPSIPLPEVPQSLAISSDGKKAFAIHLQSNQISVINLKSGIVESTFENISTPSLSDQATPTPIQTTVSVSSDYNNAFINEEVVFYARVNPRNATGVVTFFDGNIDLGSAPVNRRGEAILSGVFFYVVGRHNIIARFQGTGNFLPSVSKVFYIYIGEEGE